MPYGADRESSDMKSADGRFEYWDMGYRPVPDDSPPEDVHRFAYRCRVGHDRCSLNLRGRGHDIQNKSWTWDGNVDAPTLSPSINCQTDGCGWHGFIEGGVFKNTSKQPEPKQ